MNLVKKCVDLYNRQSTGIRYFILSCTVTVADYSILFILNRLCNVDLVIANTIGVVTGFVLHYAMGSTTVFKTPYGIAGFLVYLSTFIVGLFMANFIISTVVDLFAKHTAVDGTISMTVGKILSIILPYFVLYYLRKLLFALLHKLTYAK